MNGNLSGFSFAAISLAAAQAAGTVNATGVDMRDYQGIGRFVLHSAQPAAGTTLDVKLQHSEDNATWVDVPGGAFAQVTNAAGFGLQELVINADVLKRYVRTVHTAAGAGSATHSLKYIGVKQR